MKDELQKRVVRKLDPDLHVKTHFKAATSILMQDTKSMNLENIYSYTYRFGTILASVLRKRCGNKACSELKHQVKLVLHLNECKITCGSKFL